MNSAIITYSTSRQTIEFAPPQSVQVSLELDYQRHRLMPQGPQIDDLVCFRLMAHDGKKTAVFRLDASSLLSGLRRASERFSAETECQRAENWTIGSIQNAAEKRRRAYAANEVDQRLVAHFDNLIAESRAVTAALESAKASVGNV